jgi:hypothetical protein
MNCYSVQVVKNFSLIITRNLVIPLTDIFSYFKKTLKDIYSLNFIVMK